MAEGSETPGDEPQPPTERDLLAERRARRAIDSDPTHPTTHAADALTRRAEAAEATVQTLETHLASLQQQVLEAAGERAAFSERLGAEQAAVAEREHELRRVKQREYAEQQLRVEAEERLTQATETGSRLDRESRAESELLANRLGASEREARDLAERLERLQRQLAEAEQAAAAERAAVHRAEDQLQARLADLESRANQMQQGLAEERAARERSEALVGEMREGHRTMEGLVGEMKGIVARLTRAITEQARQQPEPQPVGTEMADALAAAVERLRARAEASDQPDAGASQGAAPQTNFPQDGLPSHKHAMSAIGRWKLRRKQRRGR